MKALNHALGNAFYEAECSIDGAWSERKSGEFWRNALPSERREFCLALVEAEFMRRRHEACRDLRGSLTGIYGKAFAEAEAAKRGTGVAR